MQDLLWRFVREGVLVLQELTMADTDRMVALMERYQDSPMDLADASLVVTAERLGAARIFTLDHHFRIYRLADGRMLDIVP